MRTLLALAAVCFGSVSFAADVPQPAPTKKDEPTLKTWSPEKTAAYLDGVAVNWTRDRKCLTCHTNMVYLFARPHLPGDGWKEVRAFAENQSDKWEKGDKARSGPMFVVVNALVLAAGDAAAGKGLHPRTKYSLDRMWDEQLPTGEWKWLKCDWPPMEHDDYYGATAAALAAGLAPGGYAKTEKAAGLAKLKAYFTKNPAPDLHHKAMLLWASTKLDGLAAKDAQAAVVAELKAKQHADGGWSLASLGDYKRRDGSPNDTAASDGYGTGFTAYVLLQAGVPASDPAVARGVAWLKANQRESGRWFTRSVSNDKAHYITNAGSAFAVLALTAVEPIGGQ